MGRVTVYSEGAPQPVGPYSQGIKAGGLVFVSGQIPLDLETGELINGDMKEQITRTLQSVESVLKAGDSSLDMAVKITVYLINIDDFSAVNEVFSDYFSEQPPAREVVKVSALPKGAQVEISAIGLAR
ncbi:MAG TPA: Rid family detoxifying hydrolase [Candidatus Aquicultor sp.]|jgi:2-iminobutanoate/2-iminopropanoate deaminase